ncbi:hypothetical protein [Herbaspirillum sp. alder98]|uniref:hypothetical protein n=1 Tax=Herbaspirillum sp. alder98 TaxID=2913096 RepID=UPI001CD8AD76|nr:hypothetical protein [Herbaspirillum sp. alder98]MCA1325778.1 hypothetical protein [Herbaspirillum sp. alder98]
MPITLDMGLEEAREGSYRTAALIKILLGTVQKPFGNPWVSLNEMLSFERFVTGWPTPLRNYVHAFVNEVKTYQVQERFIRKICATRNKELAKAMVSLWDEASFSWSRRKMVNQYAQYTETISIDGASEILGCSPSLTWLLWWARWFPAVALEKDLWTPRFDPKDIRQALEEVRARCTIRTKQNRCLVPLGKFGEKATTVRFHTFLDSIWHSPLNWKLCSYVHEPLINDLYLQDPKLAGYKGGSNAASMLFKAAVT